MSIEQIQNMFNLLDLNHDGKISFDEFQKINDGDGFKKSQGSMEYFTSAFHQLDKNKNGFLSLLELAQGLQMIGYDLTEGQVRSIFKQMDSNNDGSVDRIEFIKFMNFILKGAAVLAEVDPELEKLQKAFNIFDRDRSGFISIAEFQNFLAAKNCPLTLA
jgi:Ca2+-binding EF-hand superfamily protein